MRRVGGDELNRVRGQIEELALELHPDFVRRINRDTECAVGREAVAGRHDNEGQVSQRAGPRDLRRALGGPLHFAGPGLVERGLLHGLCVARPKLGVCGERGKIRHRLFGQLPLARHLGQGPELRRGLAYRRRDFGG